ncbi:serine/threonine-protein kinase haspin homolog isoform X2 [Carya illinoinensis]|uniref:serine/threonine-protein kinase haspin homolog isoform X2 n=1 Tax=Carya illinoinensis TaxID=32201 RepID=UPI001C71CF8B|nr:serine/threonine-protein kinase haspin homolog isoform X2 [Carya illinoinensis]
MGSKPGGNSSDLWAEIVATENQQQKQQVEVIYRRRRRTQKTPQDVDLKQPSLSSRNGNRMSLAGEAANKRVSWNRSLSTRGRTSIAVGTCVVYQPQGKQARRKGKPALPKGKFVQPPTFEKERAYFQEVDDFELLEESPSPKNFSTWAMGTQTNNIAIPHLSSRLEKWLISRKLNHTCGPSSTLSKILETPAMPLEPICGNDLNPSNLRTPEKSSMKTNSQLLAVHSRLCSILVDKDALERDHNSQYRNLVSGSEGQGCCEDLEVAVKKLSLASTSVCFDSDQLDPFAALLAVCGQPSPSKLKDVFSNELGNIVKIGEGTYGEAFKASNYVCKIVPIDGDLRVNGEVQKRSEELIEEVILSRTLNCLRECDGDVCNSCTTFIETIDLKVCQGSYDSALIKAWEDWDENNGSENDHPKEFPEKQCYVVFVLEHGGKDLESFILLNFDEARSLLVQVTAALAVAEAAYEFEHRDLHWGNILLRRNDSETLQFILEGKHMSARTFGLSISIIDFTLSRINTGEEILFLDLSSDPDLFNGPKGDRQSETYRKMKEVTDDCWDGSFPRTNVLWLLYLVDILLLKKSFERNSKNERDLRALKKRLDKYQSAKEAIFDPFFSELLIMACE